ncbi:hypothetical protein [Pseudomonas veronii]|uniref:hypothetical protein n=1 Tax=Pseudomonas veronii TaxID=76761 RepID=UPI002657EF6F|nr:hypothetical protein [Pseudomonas veronii]WKC46135.1 hypothetical protein QYP03_25435 [Pseudomonas veronii]
MSKETQPATNLQEIKKHAKQLSKELGVKYMEGLNLAAKAAGFQNWNHAFNVLRVKGPSETLVDVTCSFKWYAERSRYFRERVGHLQVKVTPMLGFSEEVLQRLVFEIPEFWIGSEDAGDRAEHFRIDSAYFHRVTSADYFRESQHTRRSVLSFHLVDSQWHATIFDYGTKLTQKEMEGEIQDALIAHVQKVARDHYTNVLDDFRVLPKDLHEEMVVVCGPAAREYAAAFSA